MIYSKASSRVPDWLRTLSSSMIFPRNTRSPRRANIAGLAVTGSCYLGSSDAHAMRAVIESAPRFPRSAVGRCLIIYAALFLLQAPSLPLLGAGQYRLLDPWSGRYSY